MIESTFFDRAGRRCARIGLVGGVVVPTILGLAVLTTSRPGASAESQIAVERALCFFWGMNTDRCLRISALVYLLEVLALAGAVGYTVSRSGLAGHAPTCVVIFAACYVASTYAAMLVLIHTPVLFVLGILLFGFR